MKTNFRALPLYLVALMAALAMAFGQTQANPFRAYQINSTFYVGNQPYLTIQSGVSAACAKSPGGAQVIILAGASPSDTPTAATGCAGVSIVDQRTLPVISYNWTGGMYVVVPVASGAFSPSTPAAPPAPLPLIFNNANVPAQDLSISVMPDESIATVFPRADIRNPRWALGTGLPSPNQGVNCVGVNGNTTGMADPGGVINSTCAVSNWVLFGNMAASALGLASPPALYVSRGTYHIQSNTTTSPILITHSASIVGDDAGSSGFYDTSPSAATITTVNAFNSSFHDFFINGNDQAHFGDGIDLVNSTGVKGTRLLVQNLGGLGIDLQGASENNFFTDNTIRHTRSAYLTEGNTNELYFTDSWLDFNGNSSSGSFYYDSNSNPWSGKQISASCPSGTASAWASGTYATGALVTSNGNTYYALQPVSGQAPQLVSQYWQGCGMLIMPESRMVARFDGDTITANRLTAKGTPLGGMLLPRTHGKLVGGYFEADSSGTRSSLAASVANIGKIEYSHLIAGMAKTASTFLADTAGWQQYYITDPNYIASIVNASDNAAGIYPADYQWDSTQPNYCQPSSYVPEMLNCQYEYFNNHTSAIFAADGAIYPGSGTGHLQARASSPPAGTVTPGLACGGGVTTSCGPGAINAPVDYPPPVSVGGVMVASALYGQIPSPSSNQASVESTHMNMIHIYGTDTELCNDNTWAAATGQWLGSPSFLCAEKIVGPVADGLSVKPTYYGGYACGEINFRDNSIFRNAELTGAGWTKISVCGSVYYDEGDVPLTANIIPATFVSGVLTQSAFTTYLNGNTGVQFVMYSPTSSAAGRLEDYPGHVSFQTVGSPTSNFNSLSAELQLGPGGENRSWQTIGAANSCTVNSLPADTAITRQVCTIGGQPVPMVLSPLSGTMIKAPGGANVYSESGPAYTTSVTLPAATPAVASVLGTFASGATTITTGSTTGTGAQPLAVGMALSGAGIQANTIVTSIVVNTSFAINLPTTAAGSAETVAGLLYPPAASGYDPTCGGSYAGNYYIAGSYYAGFNNTTVTPTTLSWSNALPLGVTYGLYSGSFGTDPNNGLTGAQYIFYEICNHNPYPVAWGVPGTPTLSQIH